MAITAMLVKWPNSFVQIFIPIPPISFHMNFGSKIAQLFLRKASYNLKSEWPFTKVKEWPWTLILTQLH